MSIHAMARTGMPKWFPYIGPLALFLVFTTLEPFAGHFYPILYCIKILAVSILLYWMRSHLSEARLQPQGQILAVVSGVVLLLLWFWIDHYTPHFKFLGARVGYDPFLAIQQPGARDAFLGMRFFGLVVVVPLIEEIFYRGFLLRYLTDPDRWQQVPLGMFSHFALMGSCVLFALSHPEWLAALVFGAAMCVLLWKTKNLSACITAHAVTNFLLGIVILQTHQWQYW